MANLNDVMKERLIETFEGETQEVTANRLHVTQGNVSKWKTGQQIPIPEMLLEIAKTYRVSVDWLMGLSDEKEVDGLVLEKLSYEQVARVLDRLVDKNSITITPDRLEIKDRMLAFIMRRWVLLHSPDLNMPDVWHNKLAPFHGVYLLKYNALLDEAIAASSPASFNEGDWAELANRLTNLSEQELQEYIRELKEKEGMD